MRDKQNIVSMQENNPSKETASGFLRRLTARVVSRANVHELLGIVTFADVLALYRERNQKATK